MRHVLDTHKDPLVSPSKINVNDYADISGRARYPLVKAHGMCCYQFYADIKKLRNISILEIAVPFTVPNPCQKLSSQKGNNV